MYAGRFRPNVAMRDGRSPWSHPAKHNTHAVVVRMVTLPKYAIRLARADQSNASIARSQSCRLCDTTFVHAACCDSFSIPCGLPNLALQPRIQTRVQPTSTTVKGSPHQLVEEAFEKRATAPVKPYLVADEVAFPESARNQCHWASSAYNA